MRRALRTWEQPISILQARINFNLYNYHVERHTYRYNMPSIPFWVTEMDKSGNRHEKVEREFEDLEVGSAHNRVGSRVTTLSHVHIIWGWSFFVGGARVLLGLIFVDCRTGRKTVTSFATSSWHQWRFVSKWRTSIYRLVWLPITLFPLYHVSFQGKQSSIISLHY